MKYSELPWAKFFGRCRATLEPGRMVWFGRCELFRHDKRMPHAIERGLEIVRWKSPWWTENPGSPMAQDCGCTMGTDVPEHGGNCWRYEWVKVEG